MKVNLPTIKTKRALLINIVLVIIAIGIYAAGFYLIDAKHKQLADQGDQLLKQALINDNLNSVRDILLQSSDNLWLLDSYYIRNDQVISYLNDLEKHANDLGLEIDLQVAPKFVPVTDLEDELITSLSIKLSANGEMADLLNFIKALALDNRLLEFNDLSFQFNEKSNQSDWIMQLELVSYHNQ